MPSDYGHELTDREVAELESRIRELYKEAMDELQNTVDAYFDAFWERDSKMREQLEAGEITAADYREWRLAQIGRGERFEALRDEMAERYTHANEVAVSYVNDKTPGIYALNRNYMAYTIEQVAGDIGFTLLDEQTVRRLIVEQPNLMPHYPALRAVQRGIDLAWGKKQITAAVTSGILQGKGLKQVADDLQKRIQTMERDSALRTARTALTGAENAGRQDSLSAAKKRGIQVKKEWLAVADSRTRHAHAVLDGQKADVDKPFKVDGQEIMYPGDPHAKGYLVYNCRCTLVGDLRGVREAEPAMRRVRNPETGENERVQDMSYAEWEKWKKTKTNSVENSLESSIIDIKKSIFTPSETIQDAKNYLWKNFGIPKADIKGIPLNSINAVNEALEELFKEYPKVKGIIQQIIVVEDKSIAAFVVNYNNGKISTCLQLGKESFLDIETLKKLIQEEVRAGTWAEKDGIKGILQHEIGHIVEFIRAFSENGVDPFSNDPKDIVRKYEAIISFERGEIAERVIDTAIENLGMSKDAWLYISLYGAENKSEAFAEALSDISGNRLSEEIKRIVKGWML